MIGIILTIIIGFTIVFISRYSTAGITLTIGNYTYSDIPLYLITFLSYLSGLLLAWIMEIPGAVTNAFQIMGLGRRIKSGDNTIIELQNRIKVLDKEIITLKERNQYILKSSKTDDKRGQNIIDNLLHRLNLR